MWPRPRPSWLLIVWSVGAAVVMIPAVIGRIRLRRLARGARPLEGPRWDALLAEAAARLGVARPAPLLQSDTVATPMTWGVWKPVIVLPANAEAWSDDLLRAAISHELAHVVRRDCLTQAPAQAACIVYWFHPLAWWAASRLLVEREKASDDLVLETGWRGVDYALKLLEVARGLRRSPGLGGVSAMARSSDVENRVLAILDGSRNRRPADRRHVLLTSAAVAAMALPAAAARLDSWARRAVGEDVRETAIAGRVLDPEGRPVAGANVVVICHGDVISTIRSPRGGEALGVATADEEGRFRLGVPRISSARHVGAHILAGSPGFGVAWVKLDRDADSLAVDLSLHPEQVIEGRLLDSADRPAADVRFQVLSIGTLKLDDYSEVKYEDVDRFGLWPELPPGVEPVWPGEVTTDADGRFRIAGVGRGLEVSFELDDPRFARQSIDITADESKPVERTFKPMLRVSGRVTQADTGEPIAGAIVCVQTLSDHTAPRYWTIYRTDADGRYEARATPGKLLMVDVYPAVGSPYLIASRTIGGVEEAFERTLDVAVPRGVLIQGRVADLDGRPLAGAQIYYERCNGFAPVQDSSEEIFDGWQSTVASDPDGRYAIAVQPGAGRLVVFGPTDDYVHKVEVEVEAVCEIRRGVRRYAHAFLPFELTSDAGPTTLDTALQPGATIVGRVEGPDGSTIDRAEIISLLSIRKSDAIWDGEATIPVRDGRFELHGVPEGQATVCAFLDAERGWGATVEIDGADATPRVVRLQPGGEVRLRLIDGQGEPVPGDRINLLLVGKPGPGRGAALVADERLEFLADQGLYTHIDRKNYWHLPKSNAEGRMVLSKLVPGTTYRIYEHAPSLGVNAYRWRDFTVASGESLDLGDVRVKPAAPEPKESKL